MTEVQIEPSGEDDLDVVLALFDEAVAWLVERGSAAQWGSEPWSQDPAKVQRVRAMLSGGRAFLATSDGAPVGALVLDHPLPYVPPTTEPEVYVTVLLASRRHRGVGSRLLDFAKQDARERGVGLLRVDCWAGGDGSLIRYYESQGFVPVERVHVRDDVYVQLFEQQV